jgi:hypothetical protein
MPAAAAMKKDKDAVMHAASPAAAADVIDVKKRKVDVDEFSDALQHHDDDDTPTPRTPITSIPMTPTTASSKCSSVGASASDVQAAGFSAAPPGGDTLSTLGDMLRSMNGAISANTSKVAANTNTTNKTAATVTKLDTKTDAMKEDVKKLTKRVLQLENAPKGGGKGGAKGPDVFSMASPRGPDPFVMNDPWGDSVRGNRAAGLGFTPKERQDLDNGWAAYNNDASNNTSRAPQTEFVLAARPGDRTGLVFGGFKADTDREEIESRLRQIMHDTEGVVRIDSLGKFAIAGKVTFQTNNLMWAFIKAHKGSSSSTTENHAPFGTPSNKQRSNDATQPRYQASCAAW